MGVVQRMIACVVIAVVVLRLGYKTEAIFIW